MPSNWARKMSKVGLMSGKERDGGGGVVTAEGLQKEHSFFSQVDSSEARQDKKLPGRHCVSHGAQCSAGKPFARWFIARLKMEMVWKFLWQPPEAAGRQLRNESSWSSQHLRGVHSGAACQGLEHSSHPLDRVMGHPSWVSAQAKQTQSSGSHFSGERGHVGHQTGDKGHGEQVEKWSDRSMGRGAVV